MDSGGIFAAAHCAARSSSAVRYALIAALQHQLPCLRRGDDRGVRKCLIPSDVVKVEMGVDHIGNRTAPQLFRRSAQLLRCLRGIHGVKNDRLLTQIDDPKRCPPHPCPALRWRRTRRPKTLSIQNSLAIGLVSSSSACSFHVRIPLHHIPPRTWKQ